ncbi:patatin-like phospholipase family protein [Endozoicomonas sp. Mp262]|uniref:patatin-like phospholipase family protein n=1 Tax=Endozoicomonas sp. Mp262 TaxID=2919499 RepID=UPI0021D9F5E5
MSKTVALVLGSGGARGYAHIGVIRELESRGYTITSVSGASMGALVGGLWAAGKLDEYCEWVSGLEYLNIMRLLDLSLSHPGFIKGEKLFGVIRDMLGQTLIESLPVPFTAVATNLKTRKEIWFQRGDLVTAVRASSAIPSLFAPVNVNGQLLVDGGVLNPLPMAPAGSAIADILIAVDCLGDEAPGVQPIDEKSMEDKGQATPVEGWLKKIWTGSKQDKGQSLARSMSAINVFYQSMEVMQESLARYKIAGHPPDILVSVPRSTCRFYDFHKFDEIEAVGRKLAANAINSWESVNGISQGQKGCYNTSAPTECTE